MNKKIIYISFLILFVSSCGTWDSVKRGMTNEKSLSTDEFLVKKKDPLILPPDFENLPSPDERQTAKEEISSFEKSFDISSNETTTSSTNESDTVENSILKKIQSK